jgi:hypothetical protein
MASARIRNTVSVDRCCNPIQDTRFRIPDPSDVLRPNFQCEPKSACGVIRTAY